MIAIIDSGVSNCRSVANMLRKAGVEAEVTAEPARVRGASKIILPGVGAFDAGMRALRARGLDEELRRKVQVERVPTLGICLGMQLFAHESEEGTERGLGWLEAEVVRFLFPHEPERKVPHMGWNVVVASRPSVLVQGQDRFYFVHSYHLRCRRQEDVLGITTYGYSFASVVGRDNIFGVQFHPEKSHRYGLALLERFARL